MHRSREAHFKRLHQYLQFLPNMKNPWKEEVGHDSNNIYYPPPPYSCDLENLVKDWPKVKEDG